MESKTLNEFTEIIEKQNCLIIDLVNENAEKENMIEVLFQELSLIKDWEQSKDNK